MQEKDFFKEKAKTYEQDKNRVKNVQTIAGSIVKELQLHKEMHIVDFGSGTGLLTRDIAPFVKKITAVDISTSMIEQLKAKKNEVSCELEVLQKDLCKESLEGTFDGLISSMTMHHIQDIDAMMKKFFTMLKPNAVLALADLESEDGSFHSENTGVHHFGFEMQHFLKSAQNAGFTNAKIERVSIIEKPRGSYGVFLLTAQKTA